MRSTYISSGKSGSENVAQKRVRTNWLCNMEVPNNEKLLQLHLMMGQIQHIHRKF